MDEGFSSFCIKSRGGYGGGNGCGGGAKCGRWNPTTEQIKVLTDLFRSGLRTPSTDQIQKISTQLSLYGKIESKNVFYWFQNHKARERQKRRRVSPVDDEQKENLCEDKTKESSSLSSHFTEVNQVAEGEKVKETLQLFPLNSFNELEVEKLRFFTDDQSKGNPSFSSNAIGVDEIHPALDLRLSFL